ncbi:hypothetical protein D3C72_1719630 [compost metagenome]
MRTSRLRCGQCLLQDIDRETMNLHVHLNCCDSFFGTRHLEVHIAGEIFRISNITHDVWGVTVHHKPHGDTGNRSLQWHAGIH